MRRRRRSAASVLLAALLLAGCASVAPPQDGAPPDADDADAPREARALPVTLEGCTVVEAMGVADAGAARALVPEGFEVVTTQEGTVRAVLGGFSCPSGDAGGLLAIPVRPLDERLEGEGVDRHFWRPEVHALAEGNLSQAYREVGADVTRATRIEATAAPTGGGATLEGDAWRHVVAFAPGPPAPGSASPSGGVFREWGHARGGYAYLEASFGTGPASRFGILPGTIETGPDTPARSLLGERGPGAVFVLTDAAYADAQVGFVPYP